MTTPPNFSAGQVLTNGAMNDVALWLVGSATVTLTTTPTNITGVFSSNFNNYRVMLNSTARSTTNRYDFKYIAGTTPTSTAYFQGGVGGDFASNTSVFMQRSNNDANYFGQSGASQQTQLFDIFNPNVAAATLHTGQLMDRNTGYGYSFGGVQTASTAFTGFQLFTNSGTITLEYYVYGYRV